MLIAARNAILAGGAALPYDAEVEYLAQNSIQAYIDSGIVATEKTASECSAYTLATPGYYGTDFFGSRQSYNSRAFEVGLKSAGMVSTWGGAYTPAIAISDPTSPHIYRLDRGSLFVDGVLKYTFGTAGVPFSTPTPIWIFAGYNYPYRQVSAVRYCKIWQDAVLVRDFIPVRVGSGSSAVGYMYDRVSGQLFGNAGTGAFVIGPDASAANGGGISANA